MQSSQVTLYWESSERADFYEIQYGLKKGNYSKSAKCASSPCTISGLTSGTTYYFNILAMNPTGSTSATEEISIAIDEDPKVEPTVEPTIEPTTTPVPTSTPTATPTNTPLPTSTPTPTATPIITPTPLPVLNTTLPTLSILPPNLAFYMNNGANANLNKSSFLVNGDCSENGSNVVLTATGIAGSTSALCAGGGYSAVLDFSSVADGAITIVANFTSSAGNSAIAPSISGVKDVLPPTVAFTNPGSGSFVSSANQAVFTVSGTCSESDRSVQLSAYGQGGESTGPLTATCASNSFSKALDLSAWGDDSITFVSNHQDSAGNLASEATHIFAKDSAPPTFALTSPANNLIINNTNQTNIVFGGTCSDDNQNIEIAVTGFETQNILCSDGSFAASLDFTGKANGSISVAANYSDQAGNSSSAITRTLTKFTANPTLTMDALAAAFANAANQGVFPVGGSCSAIGSSVTVTGTSAVSGSAGVVTTCLGLSWSATLDLSSLGEGTITFTASMSDAGGNPAPTPNPRTGIKDALAPSQPGVISLSATTTNSLTITPEISWGASSDGGGGSGIAGYEIALGTSSGSTGILPWRSVGISLSAQFTTESTGITFVNNTSYYASVRATDVAGNTSSIRSATTPWTVQLPTPTPTITPTAIPTSTPTPQSGSSFCPTGYVQVPAVPPYTNVDFCVAAFEAKQTYVGTYGSDYYAATSTASGAPWVNLSKSSASLTCAANGADYALITNSEWQAVARTIEQDSSNWSGGVLNRGWSNANNTAVAPSTNGNCLYNTGANTCASTGTFLYKRTHILAGGTIWDFAGNVSEWVEDNLSNNLDGYNFVSLVTPTRFTMTSTIGNVSGNAKTLFGPTGDYSTLTGGEYGGLGWGFYYVGSNTSIARGGKWNDAYGAGVFTANANTTQSTSVGFRCSYHPLREPTPTPTNIPLPTPTPAYGCPSEYVLVSAKPPYTASNFCVAVYEAKQITDGNNLPLPAAISQAAGSPWPISYRDSALSACQANGSNYDLISNAEWQTIARTIEADGSNWSGGVVGSGAINRGWNNSSNLSFAPSTNDSCLYGTSSNTCSASGGFLYKRTHHLPFGQIWDFSGNATEIVADSANSTFGLPTSTSLNVSQLSGSTYGLGTVGAITGTLKDVFGAAGDYNYLLNFGEYSGGGLGTIVRSGTSILRGGYGIYSTNIVDIGSVLPIGFRCVYHSPTFASEGDVTPPTPTSTPTPTPTPTPITCPSGYISASPLIPYTYSPFCVATYEAKTSGSQAVSESAGTPWVNITVLDAMSACQANGPGYELITNAEWQTLARTIESIPTNWSEGAVGSGSINRGWSYYYSTGSDGYGNTGPAPTTDSTCLYDGATSPGNVCAASGNFVYKRTHHLPNGTIWDLSGNVIEMTSDTSAIGFGTETQISQVSLTSHTPLGTIGTLTDGTKNQFGPAGNYLTLNSNFNSGGYGGLGFGTFNTANGYIFRGGYWSGLTNTGIFMVISGRATTATSSDTGFRCVYHPGTSRSITSFQPTPTPTLSPTPTSPPSPTVVPTTPTPTPEGGPGDGGDTTPTPTATPALPTPTPVLVCPPGYIQVSPLAPFTNTPYCIAVYEARNSSGLAVSQGEGTPWVSLTVADATAACRANGTGYDLITNAEWQSVARTIETVPSNWSNGYVGSGVINRGWSYFYSSGSDAVGNTGPAPTTNSSCLYNSDSGSNICAATGNFAYKRTHTLPSGTIWDLGGNVTEMTSDYSSSGFGSEAFISQVTMISHMTFATIGPLLDVPKNLFGPTGDYITLDSGDYGGLGYGYFTSQNSYIARGGYWAGGAKAGIFTVILGRDAASANSDTGFRCVYRPY